MLVSLYLILSPPEAPPPHALVQVARGVHVCVATCVCECVCVCVRV